VRVYESVVNYLDSANVRLFAGMVGSTSAPYVVEIAARKNMRYVPVRHEQVAAAMMDAVTRLDHRPGCLLTHGASGALAASTGIASAALDSVPMLVLSATQERRAMEKGWWQTSDVLQPMSSFVKWQTRVERPDRAVAAVRHALRAAVSGRPGVCQVDIPIDVSTADYDGPDFSKHEADIAVHRVLPDPELVGRVVQILNGANRVCLLVGGGATYANASIVLERLADILHAPVVNTPTSRGVIGEHHRLAFGPSGILGYEPANDVLQEADVLLAIGSRLSDLQTARGTLVSEHARIIQADIAPESLAQEGPVEVELVADALSFGEALLAHLAPCSAERSSLREKWVDSLRKRQKKWLDNWLSSETSVNGKIAPVEVVSDLMRLLPEDAILTHGPGDHGFYGYAVPVSGRGAHLVSSRLGVMGCALGYAMGARLVRPDQTIVACVGDGELMHQIGDLETMAREHLPAIVVVFNNFRLGSQRKRLELYGKPFGVEHGNPDFAKLAELHGIRGYRIDQPGSFSKAFADAMASGSAAVLDVIVNPESRPPRIAISREAR
jgi:acetolactate synthase-1/2/3 large subunit